VEVADTFTGEGVGQAVIMNKGVEVAVRVIVPVLVGNAVTTNKGVEVAEGANVVLVELVIVGVALNVRVVVAVPVVVPVIVPVPVEVVVGLCVMVIVGVDVGGRAVGETEAASLPTVISNPHT
jgi:hypothetical protein